MRKLNVGPVGLAGYIIASLAFAVAMTGTAVAVTATTVIVDPNNAAYKARVTGKGSQATSQVDPYSGTYGRVNSSGQSLVTGPVTSADQTVVLASGVASVPSNGTASAASPVISTAGYREVRIGAVMLNFAAGDGVVAWADGNPGVNASFVLGSWAYSNAGQNATNVGGVSQNIENPGPKLLLTFTNKSGAVETVYWQVVGRRN